MRSFTTFQLFKEIDLFGKEPDIYYKGKQRKTTWMGRICTWLYIFIYLFFFIYKLVRMFNRMDVSFQETNSSSDGLPKIHLTKESFTYGLALTDNAGFPIYDDTIYYPDASLVGKRTENGIPQPVYQPLLFDRCTLDDFGKNFQKFTTSLELNQFYCIKNFDIILEGYSSAENFTSIMINIKKCNGTSPSGLPCRNDSEIMQNLNRKNLLLFSEDFDLTPYNYEKPVKEKFTINSCPISLELYQTFVGYYQLTNIETENNLFGFEVFSDIKKESYIIYHSALIMSQAMYPGQQDVMTYTIMLKENTLTNQRTYVKLIDVLGDVGGLMEVIQSIFGVICVFITDILYDKTMVNNLFSFDLNNYSIRIKNKQNSWISNHNNNFNEGSSNKSLYSQLNPNNDNNNNNHEEEEEENSEKRTIDISKKKTMKSIAPISNKQKLSIRKKTNKEKILGSNISNDRPSDFKKSSIKIPKKAIFNSPDIKEELKGIDLKMEDLKIYENENKITDKVIDQKKIIKKINTNIFCTYFCFCWVRKRENFGNVLLDEAMGIITDKLDIYNMFRNFYFIDDIKAKWNYQYRDIEISTESISKLKEVSNKIFDSFYRL